MINDISELNLSEDDTLEALDAKLKDKLGIDLASMKEALASFVKDKSEELSHNFINIAPYGDYGILLEDNDGMSKFLKEEASKLDNWKLYYIMPSDVNPELIQFVFNNGSVDDGDVFQGHVFLSKNGKVRHVFTQVD